MILGMGWVLVWAMGTDMGMLDNHYGMLCYGML